MGSVQHGRASTGIHIIRERKVVVRLAHLRRPNAARRTEPMQFLPARIVRSACLGLTTDPPASLEHGHSRYPG